LALNSVNLKEKRRGAAEIRINPSGLSAQTSFSQKKAVGGGGFSGCVLSWW
jgi:hypothetical protein